MTLPQVIDILGSRESRLGCTFFAKNFEPARAYVIQATIILSDVCMRAWWCKKLPVKKGTGLQTVEGTYRARARLRYFLILHKGHLFLEKVT